MAEGKKKSKSICLSSGESLETWKEGPCLSASQSSGGNLALKTLVPVLDLSFLPFLMMKLIFWDPQERIYYDNSYPEVGYPSCYFNLVNICWVFFSLKLISDRNSLDRNFLVAKLTSFLIFFRWLQIVVGSLLYANLWVIWITPSFPQFLAFV